VGIHAACGRGATILLNQQQRTSSNMTVHRRAVADAMAMKTVKSTIVPWPELVE